MTAKVTSAWRHASGLADPARACGLDDRRDGQRGAPTAAPTPPPSPTPAATPTRPRMPSEMHPRLAASTATAQAATQLAAEACTRRSRSATHCPRSAACGDGDDQAEHATECGKHVCEQQARGQRQTTSEEPRRHCLEGAPVLPSQAHGGDREHHRDARARLALISQPPAQRGLVARGKEGRARPCAGVRLRRRAGRAGAVPQAPSGSWLRALVSSATQEGERCAYQGR